MVQQLIESATTLPQGRVILNDNFTELYAATVLDQELAAIAGLTSAADKLPYFTGAGTAGLADFSAAARTLLDDATVSLMVDTLGGASSTGTGGLVRSNTPTLVTPAVGTASANDNSTRAASTAYVDSGIAAAVTGLLDFKGNTDASANPNYPAASKGDTYYVSVAGKIGGASGKSVDVGDAYVASADNAGGAEASVGTSWFVLEHNLAGSLLAANNLSDLTNAGDGRTNLGLGTLATQSGTFSGASSGTNTGDQTNIPGNAATVTTNANLTGPITSVGNATTIADPELAALAGLTSAADKLPYFTGAGTAALADFSSAARTLLDDATVAIMVTTLGGASSTGTGGLVREGGPTISGTAEFTGPIKTKLTSSASSLAIQNGGFTTYGIYWGSNGGPVVSFNGGAQKISLDGRIVVFQTGEIGWSSGSDGTVGLDAMFTRVAAASIRQGAAAAAVPVAQSLQSQGSRAGTDSNVGGADYTISSGIGTGTGTLSVLHLSSPIAVGAGTGVQTKTDGLTIKGGCAVRVSYTVAALPAAATVGAGALAWVTDANATTFLSVVAGGGANKVPVSSDGTNWLIG